MNANELTILKIALLNEAEGEHFYKLAAENTSNPDVKNAFLSLAEEEKMHGSWLREMLQSMNKSEALDLNLLNSETNSAVSPHIFNLSKISSQQNIMEVSVFHIGILMEKASLDYYRQAAESTSSPDAKNLYETLAKWEMRHLDELEKVYDTLSEDWFDQQGFSPA